MTGLELREALDRRRKACAAGLAEFGLARDNDGPPDIDKRFFNDKERADIIADCWELLLLDADAAAQPLAGESEADRKRKAEEALRILARADKLLNGQKTQIGPMRKAAYLRQAGRDEEAKAVEAEEVVPSLLAGDHFLIGLRFFLNDEAAKAVQPLTTAARARPDHYGAVYLLAVCQANAGNFSAAVLGLNKCVDQRPQFAWPHLMRGYAYMERGAAALKDADPAAREQDFGLARKDFNEVLDQKDLDPTAKYVALVNSGVLELHQKQWDKAVEHLGKALDVLPGGPAAYINLALTHLQHGQDTAVPNGGLASQARRARAHEIWKAGVAALGEAIKHHPEMSRLYRERGRLRLLIGESGDAREDFVKAVALSVRVDKTLVDDLIQLGRLLYDQKDYVGAVNSYRAVLTVTEKHREQYALQRALANLLLAQPLLQNGPQKDLKAAAKALDAYLETVPPPSGTRLDDRIAKDMQRAFKARGIIYLEEKNFRAAIDAYSLGLKISRDPELLELRGWAYLNFQAPQLAKLDFDESLAKQPTSGAHLGRADAYVKMGQTDAAAQDADKGVTVGLQTELSYYRAARVFAQIARRNVSGEASGRVKALLRQALHLVPPTQRESFWRTYVAVKDDVFELPVLQDVYDELVKPRR
jgi:tetratricopeptide (TPR) repeat protein